jgi:AcrR family transcriptional regulator
VSVSVAQSTTSRRHRAARGQGEALRGEILAAARDLLAETGDQEAVSVRAVAERVGVTTPSIYLHFKDKDDLLDAVCAEVFEALGVALAEASALDGSPLERLIAQGRAYVHFALEKPEHYRLAFMTSGEPKTVDDVLNDSCFAQVLAVVQECMDAGIFPPDPDGPVRVGVDLWSAAHGLASLLMYKPWFPWGQVDEAVERVFRASVTGSALATRFKDLTIDQLAQRLVVLGSGGAAAPAVTAGPE